MNPKLRLTNGKAFLRARALWAVLFACASLVLCVATPSPPPCTTAGVASMLGAAVGGTVQPDDFVWEARGGFFSEAFLGRRVLFLARKNGEDQADLYRARVRLTRGGRPIRLSGLHNLTRSPAGDDRDLLAQRHHVAFLTAAFGAVQGLTVLDLDGDARDARTVLESWLTTGSARGMSRTEVTFGVPPVEVRHELQGDLLVMALGKEALPAALDLRDGTLATGSENRYAASVQRIPHPPPALTEVTVQAAAKILGDGAARGVRAAAAKLRPARPASMAMPAGSPGPSGESFPPPPMVPVVRGPALAGEGSWTTAPRSCGRSKEEVPPCLFEAAIRPDPSAPGTLVRLVAMDTRQVELRLAAGVDEPSSPVGLHGAGRPPEGVPGTHLVAVFATGPGLGFAAERRVLVPPVQGLSSVALAADGRVELGTWPFGGELPEGVSSLLQTPDAIVGFEGPPLQPLRDAGELTERSALGLLPSGQLLYAWSARAGAGALARALSLAGCTYAVPLAGGSAANGFAYLGTPAEKVSPDMSLAVPAGRAGHALVYVVQRTVVPVAVPGGWNGLTADGGRQPSPAWLPSIYASGAVSLGAQVHVTTFAPGRVSFRLRAGGREPVTKAVAALPSVLPEEEQARVVASIGVGVGKRRGARGLLVNGAVGLPLRGDDAGVLVFDHGRPRILRGSELTVSSGVDATELPMTADDGKLRAEAREVGSMRARAAACVLLDGTFAVATTTFDSDEASTNVLLELGCTRVVALDRGLHLAAFLHRAGTETPPQARYEATTIHAVEVPLSGWAGRL